MTRFLIFLALCWAAFSADGGALLIITEPTARGHAGALFDQWVAQIQREGNFSPVIVREHARWTGTFLTNDWPGLNRMSNDIVQFNPSAVQLFGHLPWLKAGPVNPDGHVTRCALTHQWLACVPGFAVEDWRTNTGMGYDAGITSPLVATNVANDGIPDNTAGTFIRPVSFIDAANLVYNVDGGTFSSGYLTGQPRQPAVDEGLWLKIYLTNNMGFRQQAWTVTETGFIRSDGWMNAATVMSVNNSVSWTSGSTSIAGRTDRWVHHSHELPAWSPSLVTEDGVFLRCFSAQLYKSYGMEESTGQATYRRHLFPGFAPYAMALVAGWCYGTASTSSFVWIAKSENVTVADAITSSAQRYSGIMPFECPIVGDLTIPIDTITQAPPATATVGTLVVQ